MYWMVGGGGGGGGWKRGNLVVVVVVDVRRLDPTHYSTVAVRCTIVRLLVSHRLELSGGSFVKNTFKRSS